LAPPMLGRSLRSGCSCWWSGRARWRPTNGESGRTGRPRRGFLVAATCSRRFVPRFGRPRLIRWRQRVDHATQAQPSQ
jgi:hypothetical protein